MTRSPSGRRAAVICGAALKTHVQKQDVKYKTKEPKELDKSFAWLTAGRTGVKEELDAVLEEFIVVVTSALPCAHLQCASASTSAR